MSRYFLSVSQRITFNFLLAAYRAMNFTKRYYNSTATLYVCNISVLVLTKKLVIMLPMNNCDY